MTNEEKQRVLASSGAMMPYPPNDGVPRDGMGALQDGKDPTIGDKTPQTEYLLPDASMGFTSIVQIAMGVLINPDIAYRTDRRQAEQMTRDPIVMGPLQKRMLATAQLDWQIVPSNKKDPYESRVAAEVRDIIEKIPRITEFFRSLGWAIFRGTGVSELNWFFDSIHRRWAIKNHRPHHGDKITHNIFGDPRMLTRRFQIGGRQLTEAEQQRLVVHIFDREDGSFYEGAEAAYVFQGRGLRDVIWPYWWLAHNALKFWVTFIERYGSGFLLGYYPMGNKAAKDAIESVLRNLLNDSKVSVPVPSGADEKTFGIKPVKMDGISESTGIFLEFVENWAGKHIRIIIEGQDQAHQEGGDGLGSGRSEALQNIFRMYRDYDAGLLEDTLTEQLVRRIVKFNYGDNAPVDLKFKFILDKEDYDQQEKRVKAAKETGIVVPKTWVYESLNIPQPTGDEDDSELLNFSAAMQNEDASAGDDPFFDGHDDDSKLFDDAVYYAWSESDHPRGQPNNSGEFAPKGDDQKESHENENSSSKHQSNPRPLNSATWRDKKLVMNDGKPAPEHIQNLKIPPAWKNITVSLDPDADLLAQGFDAKGRKQSVYSDKFSMKTAAAKFARVQEAMTKFESMKRQVERDMRSDGEGTREAASCLRLIQETGIRPGSDRDTMAKVKAYGATTLTPEHVVVEDGRVRLEFTGKKGVHLNIPVDDPDMAKMLMNRKISGGDRLFKTNDKQLRGYAHSLDGGSFKPKDFRTLIGTMTAQREVDKISECCKSEREYKKMVKNVAKIVSAKLGNTPTIALQSYINPCVFSSWRVIHV